MVRPTKPPLLKSANPRVRYRRGPAAGTNDSRVASKGERRKIELIERVVEIHAQLNLGAFSNKLHAWKPEGLLDTHVNRAVAGSAKAVTADRGKLKGTWCRQGSWRLCRTPARQRYPLECKSQLELDDPASETARRPPERERIR